MKIVAFTAIRSEYELMKDVYHLLNNDKEIEFGLIVSGAHLSKTFGYTVREIENDGMKIFYKIETLIDSDSKAARIKSAAILLQNCIDIVDKLQPDLLIYAGDREEAIVAALVGGYLEIPTIHFFGGDHVKDSHIDNPVRHATSKLSSVHFVSTEEHRDRLIKMGEASHRIFVIGSVALDKFKNEPYLTKEEIFRELQIRRKWDNFCLVIFHPIPKEREISGLIFENILTSLKERKISAFVIYPNIDPGNRKIISVIEKFKGDENFFFVENLPRKVFVNIYRNSLFIIGNSSSGIVESASIPIPAINVGYRQRGRKANENVIFSGINKEEILQSIDVALSEDFRKKIKDIKNIYGDGCSAKRAYDLIKTLDFKKFVFKDEDPIELFYSLEKII